MVAAVVVIVVVISQSFCIHPIPLSHAIIASLSLHLPTLIIFPVSQIEAADMNNNQLAGTGGNPGVEEGSELAALMAATGLSEADARALWADMGMGEQGQPSQQNQSNNQALRELMAQQQAAADQLRQQSSASAAATAAAAVGRQPGATAADDASMDPQAQVRAAKALARVPNQQAK